MILSVEGQPITTPDSLTSATALYHPGNTVSVAWESVGRHQAHQLDGAGQRPSPLRTPPLRHQAGQEAFSQASRRDSHSAILPISTYSPGVCAISEMPGP